MRRDPVLHDPRGVYASGPLDASDLQLYKRQGFLMLKELFDRRQVADYLAEIEAMPADEDLRQRGEFIGEPQSGALRSVFAIHELSDMFRRLAASPTLVGIARQILASDVYIHQSRVNRKPGFTGKEFYWHSDFETWHTEDGMPRMRALSMSLTLSDNYDCNGSLMLIPGSHEHYIACVGETPDGHYRSSLREQKVGVPDTGSVERLVELGGGISMPTGPAGSVLIFDCNTMHGSNSNITPYPRSNAFFVYNSVENSLVQPFCGIAPRPEFIATRLRDAIGDWALDDED